jgi:DNA-binding LacI/PurR family transcriptional regulator
MTYVLNVWPGSLRALAREAGVSHVTLVRLKDGDGVPSAETRARLARALAETGKRCQQAAKMLRRAGS